MIARLREERGAALVEFAIVFPVFFAVMAGSIAMIWVVGVRSAVTGAARDGARYAAIEHDPLTCTAAPCYPTTWPSAAEVKSYVASRAGSFGVDTVDVTPAGPYYRNQVIKVKVTRRIPSLFGLFDITYSSTAESRAE